MTRAHFLKLISCSVVVSVTGCFVKPYSNVGSINIRHLPDGTCAGDWIVIDKVTGKSPIPTDLKEGQHFAIQSASDMEGWCVGFKWENTKGPSAHQVLRGSYEIRYVGKLEKYKEHI